jgi:hypothetical protein
MATRNDVKAGSRGRLLMGRVGLMVALAVSVLAARAVAVDLTMEAKKTASGTVQLCIGLDSGSDKVAGTQNDLVWDAGCAALKANSCAAVPDSKKPLHGNAPANMPSTYRALVFALDNVDPIRDGKLYCCEYELTGGGDACCPVHFERLGASDPVGNALTTNGKPDKLCLATGATAAGAAPAAPAAPAAAPAASGGGPWVWILLIGVAVVIVAILLLRGRSQ